MKIQTADDTSAPRLLKLWRHRLRVVRRQTDAEAQSLVSIEFGQQFNNFGLHLTLRDNEDENITPRGVRFKLDEESASAMEQRYLDMALDMLDMILDDLSPRPHAGQIIMTWEMYGTTPLDPILQAGDHQELQHQIETCRSKLRVLRTEYEDKIAEEPGDQHKTTRLLFESKAASQVRYTTSRLQGIVHEIMQRSEPSSE